MGYRVKKIGFSFLFSTILLLNIASANSTQPTEPYFDEMNEHGLSTSELNSLLESTPTNDEQAVGFYANGTLLNANSLNDSGLGFVKLFTKRNRGYGTYDLVDILERSARAMTEAYPDGERLQVGDMSSQNGGMIGRHGSHQNGLDVDIAFFRKNKNEQIPDYEAGFAESFVKNKRVTSNFDTLRNYRYFQLLHLSGKINRIFVDKAIKKAVCNYSKKLGEFKMNIEVLRILRPYPNHDDHMHVRLNCPANSPRCVPQSPPPKGSGCNKL